MALRDRFQGGGCPFRTASNPHSYFVTGDTGFLGQALVARLKKEGHTARVAHKLSSSCDTFLACDLDSTVEEWRAALEGCAPRTPAEGLTLQKIR